LWQECTGQKSGRVCNELQHNRCSLVGLDVICEKLKAMIALNLHLSYIFTTKIVVVITCQ
jgi:hypothetical protein